MKKITAFLISAVILFTAAFPVSADTADYSELSSIISNGLKTSADTINVAKFDLSVEDFKSLYLKIVYDNPEYFWVGDKYSMTLTGNTKKVISVKPRYNGLLTDENVTKYENAIKDALLEIDDSLSDYEKVLLLHDYLVNSCSYVVTDSEPVYSAFWALVNNRALCRGYSTAMKVLLDRIGINSVIAHSDAMNHAWNMVEIDGRWYHLDATWDDPVGGVERVSHDFFLISDKTISDQNHEHYDWVSDYTADSDKYENGFWIGAESQIHYYENSFHFIKDGKIISKNHDSGAQTTTYSFSDRWYVWQSNNSHYYTGTYSALSLVDGRLYFNTPDSVYSIYASGDDLREFYTLSDEEKIAGNIYSSGYNGEKLTYTLATDPSGSDMTVKSLDISATPTGDANLDGAVSVSDAVAIARISAGLFKPTDNQKKCADVNFDDQVNILDAIITARYCAGIITDFTAA